MEHKRTNTYGLETLLCWTIADFACRSVLFSSFWVRNPSFHIFSTIQPLSIVETDSKQAPSSEGARVRADQSEPQNPLASVIGAEAKTR